MEMSVQVKSANTYVQSPKSETVTVSLAARTIVPAPSSIKTTKALW